MHKLLFKPLACAMFATSSTAFAYDIHTHTAMTSEAVAQSKLTRDPKSSVLIKQLGIRPIPNPIGDRYIDIGSQLASRNSSDFEAAIMDIVRRRDIRLTLPEPYTLTGWLMRGAIREDDNALETPNSDEPGGVFSRVYGHFFDPQNNRGLTKFGPKGARSVDWALTAGATADGRENHFKISDAREAMWRALTLKGLQNGALTTLPLTTNPQGFDSVAQQTADERNAYWATTFRALGDVVHLLQDTAQPQHTRNDAHSGYGCLDANNPNNTCLAGHDSFLEKYIKARTLNETTFTLVEGFLPPKPGELPPDGIARPSKVKPLTYTGYPVPQLANYAAYFSTGTGAANATGVGLANYSNRGFYSFGTNINDPSIPSYPLPPWDGAGLATTIVPASQAENMVGIPLSFIEKYIKARTLYNQNA